MTICDGLLELLRSAEAARALGIPVVTLRRWEREGKLRPLARSEGGHRRYARADIFARIGLRLGVEKTAAIYACVSV